MTTPAADFIDRTLQMEASEERAITDAARIGGGLRFYGASVGAVRGAVRDARRRHPELTHDEVTALASELWSVPVYERRLAAVVLLQGQVSTLLVSDFTRFEQLLRSAGVRALVDPLMTDVALPLLGRLDGVDAARARRIVDRWEAEGLVDGEHRR
ncbi:DNA alkylation repair protein [Agromyces sp. PvR057]|uniref:DNA alkylation repair protein n=1 Tax=Agromyces sp. PvR057 TaxID=3156403 RepID=UPI000E37AC13